ncbi:MAG: glycosyltransferase family 4 protein [Clostridia bacterium]|nr:glycosyltransferase family 4 protein [Clostridia bacterium]
MQTEKRRILVVCQHFWPENFRINDICEGFVENDIEVDVLCGEPNYPKGEWFDGYGAWKRREEKHGEINIYRCFEIKRGSNSNVRIFLNYMTFPYSSAKRVRKLYKNHYDRVFIYSLSPVYMGKAGLKIAKKKKIPSVTYVMDLWPENLYSVLNFKNKLIRKILYKTSTKYYIKTDKLICMTKRARDILAERTGKSRDEILIMPQCPEKIYSEKVTSPELWARFGGGFNIVYTGNISPAQDFPIMVEAAKRLEADGISANWIIVGDGMSRGEAEKLVAEEGLAHRFFFEGQHPMADVPKYASVASCLVACLSASSLLECTIPAKVTSYIAMGRPIVLAMDGEAREIIAESGAGFAGPAGDADALYANLKRVYDAGEDGRLEMGRRADKLYLERFERDENLRKLIDFIFE